MLSLSREMPSAFARRGLGSWVIKELMAENGTSVPVTCSNAARRSWNIWTARGAVKAKLARAVESHIRTSFWWHLGDWFDTSGRLHAAGTGVDCGKDQTHVWVLV